MVEEGGFEPPKLEAADLQSVPFGHSGTPPYTELRKRKLIFIKTGNPFVARRTHCSLETIVIIIHRCAKVNPVFAKICVFSRGKNFTVLVWLDIIALGRYTVFIAAGSCDGVEAPDLFL